MHRIGQLIYALEARTVELDNAVAGISGFFHERKESGEIEFSVKRRHALVIFVVITQMYVADIIGKLPEKFYRVDSGEVRLLDVEHHMKIRTEARFQLIHKLRRLPVMMDNIFLGENYPLLLRVADEQIEALCVFVRADIHRLLCAVEHDYFRAYRRRGGIVFL